MEEKLSSKEMLLDICSMRSRAVDLLKEGKEYNTLLAIITEKDYYYDGSLRLPSLKALAGLTGLKYDLVRKQLKQVYEDLLPSYENKKLFQFQNVKYEFYVKGVNNSLFLDADSLPVVPRIGENINIPFFKAYLGTDNFHVIEIQHTLSDNLQTIQIELKPGSYNLYWNQALTTFTGIFGKKKQKKKENFIGRISSN